MWAGLWPTHWAAAGECRRRRLTDITQWVSPPLRQTSPPASKHRQSLKAGAEEFLGAAGRVGAAGDRGRRPVYVSTYEEGLAGHSLAALMVAGRGSSTGPTRGCPGPPSGSAHPSASSPTPRWRRALDLAQPTHARNQLARYRLAHIDTSRVRCQDRILARPLARSPAAGDQCPRSTKRGAQKNQLATGAPANDCDRTRRHTCVLGEGPISDPGLGASGPSPAPTPLAHPVVTYHMPAERCPRPLVL